MKSGERETSRKKEKLNQSLTQFDNDKVSISK